MSYIEDDATELMKDIYDVLDQHTELDKSFKFNHNNYTTAQKKILQLIRKKLKLTRTYHTFHKIKSPTYGKIEIETEEFVEDQAYIHTGYRLIFGEVQSEDDEKSNIKFLTGKEIREIARVFAHILKNCNHQEKSDWIKVDMGIGEDGEHWYHYICNCGILQDVEIIPEA